VWRIKIKGIHFSAAESIAEYIQAAGIESSPLFRPRVSRHGDALAPRRMNQRSMYRVPQGAELNVALAKIVVRWLAQSVTQEHFPKEKPVTIATGGFGRLFQHENLFDEFVPELPLIGLRQAVELSRLQTAANPRPQA
jgi:hypothetical protein